MKEQILIFILSLSLNFTIAQTNQIWYSFVDEETEFVGFKNKEGEIMLPANYSILVRGRFINIVALWEWNEKENKAEAYYLLKNGKKVGVDSIWSQGMSYDCEHEGFIRFRDENYGTGMFNKHGEVIIPADYNYLSKVKNGVVLALKGARKEYTDGCDEDKEECYWRWEGGIEYLLDTNNNILVENFGETDNIDFYSLKIKDKPSKDVNRKSYLGKNGKFYTFVDAHKEFENWFLEIFTKSLETKKLVSNIYERPIYGTKEGWETRKKNDEFVNTNYLILKILFENFSERNNDYFIHNEFSIVETEDRYEEFDKYRNNCYEFDTAKYPIMEVVVNLDIGKQNQYTFIRTEKGYKLVNIVLSEGELK
jgi:hypothetical protein